MTADAPIHLDFWGVITVLANQYPDLVALLSKPGIFEVAVQMAEAQAAGQPWPKARIDAALRGTEYYQTTPARRAQFDILSVTDPATAKQQVTKGAEDAARLGMQLGIPLNGQQTLWLGVAAAQEGWDENRIRAQIVANTNSKDQTGAGAIGDQIHQYQGLASQYAVPIDDQALYWWAANTLGGSVTQEGFRDYLTEQAINLYPALKSPLEQGMSVAQYAAPYLSNAANELGINPNSISLSDPKWTDTFIGANDKGEQRVLSMQESLSKIRTEDKYGYDQGLPGKTRAAESAQALLEKMGFAA